MKNYWLNRKAERDKPQVAMWDFHTALAETIREKYEHLYIKVVEVSNVINGKVLRGRCNWLVANPEVASVFESAVASFAPSPSEKFISWQEGGF
jgi:hypothetical protein